MANRRNFIQHLGLMAGAFSANSLFNQAHAAEFEHINLQKKLLSPKELAMDEDYWSVIQQGYTVSPSLINLNNGGVCPSPRIVQEAVERFNKMSNEGPSYYMWRILDQGREPLRYKLAQLAGCDPEEIAINRNATEALNTVIFGLNLKAGDEVVGSKFDYPNMINAWKQRASREGIVYKQLDFKFPSENEDEMVRMYENAITPKTKIFHITHMVNWVGQIMPVKKLCALAKKHGIETIVDGAHSFGLMDFTIPELGERKKVYEKFSNLDSSIIIFLPARDLVSIIKEMKEFLGERKILVAKEITKIHENIIKGTLHDILDKVKSLVLKGEVTIVLSSEANKNKDQNVDLNKEILDLSKKMKTADLAKYLSKKFKFSKKEIYQKILILDKK